MFEEMLMMNKYLTTMMLMLLAVMLAGGCSRIHEPWVQSEQRLAEERARPPEQIRKLQNRLLQVQTDR